VTRHLFHILIVCSLGFTPQIAEAASQAKATARVAAGFVSGITLTELGGGYEVAPSVSLEGGGGSGAMAVAILEGDFVGTIVVTVAGTGYSDAPAVVIEAPPEFALFIDLVPKLTLTGSPGTAKAIFWSHSLGASANWRFFTNVVMRSAREVVVDLEAATRNRYYRIAEIEDVPGSGEVPEIGENFLIGDMALEFIAMPEGNFVMGSPSTEGGHRDDEGPQKKVIVSKSFWMGKYEVTQGQYEELMGDNPSWFQRRSGGRKSAPVENVSWVWRVSSAAA